MAFDVTLHGTLPCSTICAPMNRLSHTGRAARASEPTALILECPR